MKRIGHILLYALCAASLACRGAGAGRDVAGDTTRLPPKKDSTYESLAGDFAAPSSFRFDSLQLNQHFKQFPAFRPLEKEIRTFYRMRGYAYAWYDRRGLTEQAGNLYNRIRQLPVENPGANLPYIPTLDTLMEAGAPPDTRLKGELLLTSAYFFLPPMPGAASMPRKPPAWPGTFRASRPITRPGWKAMRPAPIRPLASPCTVNYHLLRDYLRRYRDLDRQGPLDALASPQSYRRVLGQHPDPR